MHVVQDDGPPGALALAHHLATVSRIIRDQFDTRLEEEADATMPTWLILSALASEECISQRRLALLCHMEGPSLTKHLERLTRNGVVSRQRDRKDRRIVRVSFTPEGRQQHLAISRVMQELEAGVEALLSPEEHELLRGLLGQCLKALDDVPTTANPDRRPLP